MWICLYTDQQQQHTYDWQAMLIDQGHRVTVARLGQTLDMRECAAAIVLVDDGEALPGLRFWLATLELPLLLITPALTPAQALCRRVPALRVICHPNRAAYALVELLGLTCTIRAGTLVVGQAVTPPVGADEQGEPYVWN